MKILGLSFGKKMGNNEVLIKEALMGAEEAGVEIMGFVRALDLDIKPCKGCLACSFSQFAGGPADCVIKDDLPLLDELLLECDGMIIGAPVFVLAPPGLLKDISDRRGPSHDPAWLNETKRVRATLENPHGKPPDERAFKKRYGGFIATGGASTPNWLSLGLPLMHLFTYPTDVMVMDQMLVHSITKFLNSVMNDEAIARAHKLGQNVARAMLEHSDHPRWMAEDPGTCPVCHSNLITIGKKNPIECPICGIKGELKINKKGEFEVTFSKEEQLRSRLFMAGKKEHCDEVRTNAAGAMQNPRLAEMPERLKKYEGYKELKLK